MADQYYVETGYVDDGYYAYIADATIVLDASFEQTTIADFIPGFNIALNSEYQLSNIPEVNRSTQLTLDTIITLFEQSDRIRTDSSTQSSEFNFTINVEVIRESSINLESNYQVLANTNIITDTNIDLLTEYQQQINETRLRQSSIDQFSEYTLVVDESIIESETTYLNSEWLFDIVPNIITDTTIDLVTDYQQISQVSRVVETSVNIASYFEFSATGIVAQFKYVYMIAPETRDYMIEYEERTYIIEE